MPKYRNASNRVLVVNGVRIPPGGVIETTETIAKTARGSLQRIQDTPPKVVVVEKEVKTSGGLTDEERQRLENMEKMFSMFMEKMEGFPEMVSKMKDDIQDEIKNIQPQVIQVQGEANATVQTGLSESEPVPVILDEFDNDYKSNIGESTEAVEKKSGSVKSKRDKLKKLKEKSK
jgi:hypothetical protein